MDFTAIVESATKFTHSYAAACALAITSPGISTDEIATAIASHYKPKDFASFTSGFITVWPTPEIAQQNVKSHLDGIARQGFGLDLRLERLRVEPVSSGCAMCFVTWSLHPPPGRGVEAWEWENMYSYRETEGVGKWEFTVADNEIAGLMARAPKFWEGREGMELEKERWGLARWVVQSVKYFGSFSFAWGFGLGFGFGRGMR